MKLYFVDYKFFNDHCFPAVIANDRFLGEKMISFKIRAVERRGRPRLTIAMIEISGFANIANVPESEGIQYELGSIRDGKPVLAKRSKLQREKVFLKSVVRCAPEVLQDVCRVGGVEEDVDEWIGRNVTPRERNQLGKSWNVKNFNVVSSD